MDNNNETVEQAAIDYAAGSMPHESGFLAGAQWQSQHAATSLAESQEINNILSARNEFLRAIVHLNQDANKELMKALSEKDKRIQELEQSQKWISVSDLLPPFDKLIELRGVINWKSKNAISYFSDVVTVDCEMLEYGVSGYLLKEHSEYLVVNHHNPDEVCSEYITHWRNLIEPVI